MHSEPDLVIMWVNYILLILCYSMNQEVITTVESRAEFQETSGVACKLSIPKVFGKCIIIHTKWPYHTP